MTVDRSYGFGTQNNHSIFNTIKYMKLFRQSVFAIFFCVFFPFARPKLNEMNWKETTTTRYLCVQIGIVYILCWLWAQFSLFHEFFFSSCCFQVEIYCACIIYISMTHMIFLSSFPFLSLFFVDLFFPHLFDGKQSMNFFLHFFHNFFFPSKVQVCESKQAQRHPISKKKYFLIALR